MNEERKITVELTKQQLVYIQNALEEHFRLRMGQVSIGGLTDDLAAQNVDLSTDNPNHDAEFDAFIERRDRGLEILKEYMNVCFGTNIARYQKTQEVIDEIDLWHAIRHFLWDIRPESEKEKTKYCTAADKPCQFGNEPLPKIEIANSTQTASKKSAEDVIESIRAKHRLGSTETINGLMFCDGWEAACDEMLQELKDI